MKFFESILLFACVCVGVSHCKGASSVVCGGSSSAREISLVNPKSPPNDCDYEISAYSKKVCQIRIDFSMSLAQPDLPDAKNGYATPQCVSDRLVINDDLVLCGSEDSQHLYFPMNRTAGIISLSISIKSTQRTGISKLPPLSWDIQVTQLECPSGIDLLRSDTAELRKSVKDGYLLAPSGCNQYFYEEQGTIKSFNYNDGKGIYPYDFTIVSCFTRTTATTGMMMEFDDFNLNQEGNETSIFAQIDSQCYPQLPTEGRVEDYLWIPQAQVMEEEIRATYYCGKSLNGKSVMTTYPGPLSMMFNSGGLFKKGTKSRGFSMNYEIISEC